jgi:hypothetical protein
MSNKESIVKHEEELMKGAYSWWKEAEEGEATSLVLYVRRSGQRGVFTLELVATDRNPGGEYPINMKVTRMWPNAEGGSLGALVFAMVTSIGRMIDDAAVDRVGVTWRALDRG